MAMSGFLKAWFTIVYVALGLGLTLAGILTVLRGWHGGWDFFWASIPAAIMLIAGYHVAPELAREIQNPAPAAEAPKPKRPPLLVALRVIARGVSTSLIVLGYDAVTGQPFPPIWAMLIAGFVFGVICDGLWWLGKKGWARVTRASTPLTL